MGGEHFGEQSKFYKLKAGIGNMQSRDQYIADLKATLDEWNEQVGKTEAQMNAAADDTKARYAKQIEEMKAHADDAQKRMTDLSQSSAAEWEKRRPQFEAAWNDISAGFGRAWSRFS